MKVIRIVLAMLLFFAAAPNIAVGGASAGSHPLTETLRGEPVYIPQIALDVRNFSAAGYSRIFVDGGVKAVVALYGDPRTRRNVNFVEFYEGNGDLLFIAKFDRFGILRVAADHEITGDSPEVITGVLIFITGGNPV